jgi:SHS2 domain-containing protein
MQIRTPLTVITGPLGSGKTTLLRHILDTVSRKNDALDLLLFNFLQEFIYYKDSELLLLRAQQVQIEKKNADYHLTAVTRGETLERERHQERVDVKAVTLHRFQLEKTDEGWMAMVILDI